MPHMDPSTFQAVANQVSEMEEALYKTKERNQRAKHYVAKEIKEGRKKIYSFKCKLKERRKLFKELERDNREYREHVRGLEKRRQFFESKNARLRKEQERLVIALDTAKSGGEAQCGAGTGTEEVS